MVTINKIIENLKPGKQYLVTVRPKDADLNLALNPVSAVRFTIPTDSTIPADLSNLVVVGNYKSIMISFNPSNEADLRGYNYQIYLPENIAISGSKYVIVNNATPYLSGFSASNVITVDVPQNSETTNNVNANTGVTTTTTTERLYFARVQSVDTTGNVSEWTPISASSATTLIDSAHIIDLTASKITAGTIGAHTITMAGINSILKSSNYQAANTTFGGTGWKISGDGKAVFNDASIRSSLDIGEDQGTSDATSFHVDANGNMWSGANSASYGIAPFRVSNQGEVTAKSLTLTGNTILSQTDNSKIYLGTGVYNNTNTPFYVDSSSQFSLGNKLTWDGSSLTITGNVNITGGNTLTLINEVQQDADAAYSLALTANGIAVSANTLAGTAYSTAITAQGIAITAETKADNAQNDADSAYNLASTKITAGEVVTTINGGSTTISGDKITTGTLNADRISGGTITASISINSPSISGASISGGTISGSTMTTGGFIVDSSGAISTMNITCADQRTLRSINFPGSASGTTARIEQLSGVQRITQPSSNRIIKENIEDIPNALSFINKLRPRQFNFKESYYGEIDPSTNEPWTQEAKDIHKLYRSYGFIVEEVQEVDSQMVVYRPNEEQLFDITKWQPSMWKDLELIAFLTKAVQELSNKVEELEARLN